MWSNRIIGPSRGDALRCWGFKSLYSAAVTLAGVELARRIRKGQHLVPLESQGKVLSLKDTWDRVLSQEWAPATPPGRLLLANAPDLTTHLSPRSQEESTKVPQ